MEVIHCMTEQPVTLIDSDSVKYAAEVFLEYSIDGIPVTDGQGKLTGIFTKNHLYSAFVSNNRDSQVSSLMNKDPLTVNSRQTVWDVWNLALKTQVGRFPVVDDAGNLVGIITKTNLIHYFYKFTENYRDINLVFNSSYDCMVLVDNRENIIQHNSAFINMEHDLSDIICEVSSRAIQKKSTATLVHPCPEGSEMLLTGTPVCRENYEIPDRVVVNCRDITELNKLRREVETTRELSEIYHSELEALRTRDMGHTIICESLPMRNALDLAVRVAKVDSTILILGESGVGKDLIASLIQRSSSRSNGPFIRIDCSAIPENLLESELFGYAPGAFTGASKNGKPGLIELAHRGTLFLNEIAEIPLSLQAKLLNVIQDQQVSKVGGTTPVKVDIRIIAATNKDLSIMTGKGEFRPDLYYRLNVVPITIPPLRERTSDISPLVVHFLRKYNEKYQLNKSISPEAMEYLVSYKWPGNVRELENLIERLVVITRNQTIEVTDLPSNFLQQGNREVGSKNTSASSEKKLIKELYQRMKSTRKVAEAIGVHQSTVVRKMKKYNIKRFE